MKMYMLLNSILSSVFLGLTLNASASPAPFHVEGADILGGPKIEATVTDTKKGVVLVFLSAKCPCSNSHTVELRSLVKEYPDFEFVGVHSNGDEPHAREYFEKAGLPFRVIEDKEYALANQFKALKTPHSFVFDSTGHLLYQGGVSDSRKFERATKKFLRSALADIEAGRAVAVTEGRTLGCEISRGKTNVW